MTLATIPRYERGRLPKRGDRAVVLGAGMAGLSAARVLSDAFDEVTVVDRDPLPDEPVARRGVPQAEHIHVLLRAGSSTLEDLFPGFGEELASAGGLLTDNSRDNKFFANGDFLAETPARVPLYCGTRALYERVVRRRVADLDGASVRQNCQFVEYSLDEAGRTVDGVVVRREESGTEELAADLVVDATGRTSRTPAWLRRRGYEPPPVDEVHVDLGYSTVLVDRPPDDRRSFVVTPSPGHARGGGVLPVEGDRWLVTLVGLNGEYPPTDWEGLASFAGSLPTPALKRLLDERPPAVRDVAHYRFPSNRRYRYERLDRFPGGLLVVGDAIASFNPIYAQGMSVAALESLTLHHALAEGGLNDLAPRFFGRAAETVDIAWNMAVGADHQFPGTTGPKPRGADLANAYLARLTRRAHTDAELSAAFYRVLLMQEPPGSLFRPRVLWRVFGPKRFAGGRLPRPSEASPRTR